MEAVPTRHSKCVFGIGIVLFVADEAFLALRLARKLAMRDCRELGHELGASDGPEVWRGVCRSCFGVVGDVVLVVWRWMRKKKRSSMRGCSWVLGTVDTWLSIWDKEHLEQ